MRTAAQKLRHLLCLVRTFTPTQMRRPELRSMPRRTPTLLRTMLRTMLRTLLRTLLTSLVPRHPLRMLPTDCARSSAECPQPVAHGRERESEADYVSPVAASIYCSPHPAALQIDSPPGSVCFASR